MRTLPNLSRLVAFDAVARHLSFSRAGRELHVTQGAISHRIRALEEELGVVLVARTTRSVRLTPAGTVLYRATDDAFTRLADGVREMEAVDDPHRVTVSCSPSFAIRWLVPHLAALHAEIPDLNLHVSAEDRLVEPGVGAIDACIRFGPGGYPGVDQEQLTEEVATPVCSPLYVERVGLSTPADLRECRLLHDDVLAAHADHVGWREWLAAAGAPTELASHGLHFSHSHMAIEAAMAGEGVALARRTLVMRELRSGRLVAPFATEVRSALTYWLITPSHAPATGALRLFRDWLRSTIAGEMVASA